MVNPVGKKRFLVWDEVRVPHGASSNEHDIQQCEVGLLTDEPDPGLPPDRLAQQNSQSLELGMVALQAENTVVSLEKHAHTLAILLPEFRGHVVVGTDQCRD